MAHKAWHDALEDKNTAAGVAISAITEVVSGKKNHGLAHGLWDDFVGSDFFKIVKTVCDWAGVLAIFLSWVPILGQFLIVLAAVGASLAIVQAAVKLSEGNGSWGSDLCGWHGCAHRLRWETSARRVPHPGPPHATDGAHRPPPSVG